MPVKIRLQRHGKKGKPFYWIVAADSRSKRDGKSLEKLGTYNPNTNPATIDLNIDGAVKWLQNGAQPTDTARAILSYKGALLKNHLAGGVRKGALTEEQAEEKFNAWAEDKAKRISAKVEGLSKADAKAKAKALEAEKEANEARKAKAIPVEEVTEEAETATEAVAEDAPQTIDEAAAEAQAPVAEKVDVEAKKEEATEASSEEE
ncbi:30S ribosomal protein S16 [Aureibaculum conchae]|uniref:30S ribosomal protein S16 n=1 Tax=Aureibaculum sp. 2308TA14-22 TaxID=3108392 RepID=UPI00339514B5